MSDILILPKVNSDILYFCQGLHTVSEQSNLTIMCLVKWKLTGDML